MKTKELGFMSTQLGGATLTKVARDFSLNHMNKVLQKNGMNVPKIGFLKEKHVRFYVENQIEKVSRRTLQNRMAHLRAALRNSGCDKLAAKVSNKSLEIAGASRDGTHQALNDAQFAEAMAKAKKIGHPGFLAALELQRELGLRAREVIQCADSLKSWEKALMRNDRVHIIHGTKGKRARDTAPNDTQKALQAVRNALQASKHTEGRLIQSKSLEGAARAYQRLCKAIGLTGKHASHALRCTYAQNRYAKNLEITDNRKEALALTSLDLGHGDGRGTYVAQVYLKNPPG